MQNCAELCSTRSLGGGSQELHTHRHNLHPGTALFLDEAALISLQSCGLHTGNLHHQEEPLSLLLILPASAVWVLFCFYCLPLLVDLGSV